MHKLAIIACSLACGALSWRFIEQPFRSGPWRPTRTTLFRLAGAATTLLIVLGAVGWADNGFPSRFTPRELQIAAYLDTSRIKVRWTDRGCFIFDEAHAAWGPDCLSWDPGRPNYLLLGDSHAAELWLGLRDAYAGINFLEATAANCFPVIDHALGEAGLCTRPIDELLYKFLPAHRIDRVVLAARWKTGYAARIAGTLDWFRAKNIPVTLVGPTVVYDAALPRLLLIADRTHDPKALDEHWDHSLVQFDDELATLAAAHGATYISMLRLFCHGYACSNVDAEGFPLMYDAEHFTPEGSEVVARKLKAAGLWNPEPSMQRLTATTP